TALAEDYFFVQRGLLANLDEQDMQGTYWQSYLCKRIVESENKFSLMAELGQKKENLQKMTCRELFLLKRLFALDWQKMSAYMNDGGTCLANMSEENFGKRKALGALLSTANSEEENKASAMALYEYYLGNGCGIFEKYEAFAWEDRLVGIGHYEDVTFEKLVGYEMQKKQLIENTKFLLQGSKANNVLLYGDRGTGKSSSVKALLNMFKHEKLKMVSINKNHIKYIDKIMEEIEGRGCKFIVFVDDLTFEEDDVEYKYFKSAIEGGIEGISGNTLIYVTSNRRNIIRETWKERSDQLGDIHQGDGIQERMSLSERFGLALTFSSPGRLEYLEIVKELARQEDLQIEPDLLEAEALKWEVRHNGRSGRTARQFINYLKNMSTL
ncbi:MAG: ATP-binding protein, partial [Anaerovorax sp.]